MHQNETGGALLGLVRPYAANRSVPPPVPPDGHANAAQKYRRSGPAVWRCRPAHGVIELIPNGPADSAGRGIDNPASHCY